MQMTIASNFLNYQCHIFHLYARYVHLYILITMQTYIFKRNFTLSSQSNFSLNFFIFIFATFISSFWRLVIKLFIFSFCPLNLYPVNIPLEKSLKYDFLAAVKLDHNGLPESYLSQILPWHQVNCIKYQWPCPSFS